VAVFFGSSGANFNFNSLNFLGQEQLRVVIDARQMAVLVLFGVLCG
jgi:hypothetical protein